MPRRHLVAETLGIKLPAAARADPRPWHAVVMSRLGRRPLARRVELATLYRWTEHSIALGEAPLTVAGTAAHRWVVRACELVASTAVQLVLTDRHAADRPADPAPAHGVTVHRVDAPGLSRDALAVLLADRVDAALVRPQGTIFNLLLARLAQDRSGSVRVLVPVQGWGQGEATQSGRAIQQLIAAGAIGYCCKWEVESQSLSENPLIPAARGEREQSVPLRGRWPRFRIGSPSPACGATACCRQGSLLAAPGSAGGAVTSSLLASLARPADRWLIHCTRGRQGAWPGQSEQQFHDWLLLTCPTPADLSPLATLKRIVGQRQLVGTSRTIPGGQAVVCFSALPLLEVVSGRVYRAHLGRWDAEPYGLAIDAGAAERMGAQKVIYTAPGKRSDTPSDQQWRMQSRGRTFDWTREREWRLRGTADLRRLGADEAVVFVDRDEEVEQFAGAPWPVISVRSLRIASEGIAKHHALG